MDLNLISKQIQFMPDAQLAQSVKNPSGVMPSYLALAELNRRQKIRSSSPQQEPQGTVADEVLQSLHSAGMQPQMPMQQGASMPQQMGIAQAQPQAPGMRRGGIVGFAGGGQTNVPQSGYDALFTPPPQMEQPVYDPSSTSIQDSAQQMRSLYGPGQDYSEELQGIKQLRGNLPKPQSLGQLQGLYTMASKDPMGGLAQASLDARSAYQKQNDDYYKNMMSGYENTFGIKNTEEKRSDEVANAIRDYWHVSNTIGIQDATNREKAQHDRATLVEKYYKDAIDKATAKTPVELQQWAAAADDVLSHPDQHSPVALSQAEATKKIAGGALDRMAQTDKDKEDQKHRDAMALADKRGAYQLQTARITHSTEAGNGSGVGATAGDDEVTIAAKNWITTGDAGIKGYGAASVAQNAAARRRAAQIMQQMGITAEQLPGIRANYKANSGELQKLQTQYGQIAGFEKNVEAQFEPLMDAAQKVTTTRSELFNKVIVPLQEGLSMPGTKSYTTYLGTVADEYAKVMGGQGQTSDQARNHAQKILNDGLSKNNLKESVNTLYKEMNFRLNKMQEELANATGRTKLGSLAQYTRTGQYPQDTGSAANPEVGDWPGLAKYGKGAKAVQPIATPTAPSAAPSGIPAVGSTFNGGRVKSVTRMQ